MRERCFLLSLKDLVSMKSDLGAIKFQSVYNWNRCANTQFCARMGELGALWQDDGLRFVSQVKSGKPKNKNLSIVCG